MLEKELYKRWWWGSCRWFWKTQGSIP